MSGKSDNYSLKTSLSLTFGQDFLSAEGADESVDTAELGLLLGTLTRSCENCGTSLEAGTLQSLLSWESGQAIRLERTQEGFNYACWEGVSGWEDFDDVPWAQVLSTEYLLDVTRLEVVDRLCGLPGVAWTGIRDFESGQWEECTCFMELPQERIQQATRLVLQLDTLLKGHNCPRGRLRLDFDQSSLWAWSNSGDDYLMAMADRDLPLSSRGALLRIGEAFMLF